jgi:hypothetical protein
VHVTGKCNEVIIEMIAVVQLWKVGLLGFGHKVGPAQPGFAYNEKDFDIGDFSAVCTNNEVTVWYATMVQIHGTAQSGNLMFPVGPLPQSNDSDPLPCGT